MGELNPFDHETAMRAMNFRREIARFRTPPGGGRLRIRHEATEFSHLCPFTGHPDYAAIVIEFRPREWCVELKELKLYLQQFRDLRISYEALMPIVFDDVARALGFDEPDAAAGRLRVAGRWKGRGGIRSALSIGAVSEE